MQCGFLIELCLDVTHKTNSVPSLAFSRIASLYRISYEKSLSLDKVLPYSSVFCKKVPHTHKESRSQLCSSVCLCGISSSRKHNRTHMILFVLLSLRRSQPVCWRSPVCCAPPSCTPNPCSEGRYQRVY